MNFDYSEDQLMIQQMTQDFAKKEILPNINVWDEKQYFPTELFKKAGKQGLMGVLVPEKFGGSGLGYFLVNHILFLYFIINVLNGRF